MGESDIHYLLKEIGVALLLRKGCSPVGMEVRLPVWERARWSRMDMLLTRPDFVNDLQPSTISIADAAGIMWIHPELDNRNRSDRFRGIFAIEAKVSRSDFQRGFCTHGWNKLWLITPPGLLKPGEVPGGVGLYEYDADAGAVALKGKAAMRPFEPSDTALKDIENTILWQGYGRDIGRLYEDERIKKVLGGQQVIDANDTKPKETE
mgnify:FL=1